MLRKLPVVLLSAGAFAFSACSSSTPTPDAGSQISCTGTPPTCTIPAGVSGTAINSAVASAVAGTTFSFAATDAPFAFNNTMTVPGVANLTFKGAGMGTTVLDFSGQTGGADGIDATLGNTNIKFEGFTLQNSAGDGIKVESATGVVFEGVQVQWTNNPDGGVPNHYSNGAYGIYPVQSQNILIDNCQVSGARDTGIYVGQSYTIVVSNNHVSQNVAGIEIESSNSALVTGNESMNNVAGILIFGLPNLQPPPDAGQPNDGTYFVTVSNNNIHDNNMMNFADPSGTVAIVPGGTGFFVAAASDVDVFGNTFTNNGTLSSVVVSYCLGYPQFCENPTAGSNPTGLDPFPHNVFFHSNTYSGNGSNPVQNNGYADGGTYPNPFAQLFAALSAYGSFGTVGAPFPDIGWDGIAIEPAYTPPQTSSQVGTPPNPQGIWLESNHDTNAVGGAATWTNLNLPVIGAGGTLSDPGAVNLIAGPFTITDGGPADFPLPPVDAGVTP